MQKEKKGHFFGAKLKMYKTSSL